MYAYETSIRRTHIHGMVVKRPIQIDAQTALCAHERKYVHTNERTNEHTDKHTPTQIHAVTVPKPIIRRAAYVQNSHVHDDVFFFSLLLPHLGSSLFHSF